MEIDKSIIARYYPSCIEYGDVFKLIEKNGYCIINTYYKDDENKTLVKVDNTYATIMGDLWHIKEEQIKLNQLVAVIREVIREELHNIKE